MELTNQGLAEAAAGARNDQQEQFGTTKPPQPQLFAAGTVGMDRRETEKTAQQRLRAWAEPLESNEHEHHHFSSFNPFSLSNSNDGNLESWDSEFPPYAAEQSHQPQQASHQPAQPPQPVHLNTTLPAVQQISNHPFVMDPNDHSQYYYHQPGSYSHYAHSYAPSSGASNPASPQNGFVPYYADNTQVPAYPQYAAPGTISAQSTQQAPSPQTLEDHELKRLRNTAASARFRAKKKQREAQLESAAKEKKERLEALEKRIHDLEEENKWLKALIMEKKDVAGEVARLRERFGKVEEEMREFESAKDGVGTSRKGGKKEDK